MALISTKTMARQNRLVDWYDINVVPPRFDEYDPGVIELSSEESANGLVRTDITSWPDIETWNDSWTYDAEWEATITYWTIHKITVTWRLVDDATNTELDFQTRGYAPA